MEIKRQTNYRMICSETLLAADIVESIYEIHDINLKDLIL